MESNYHLISSHSESIYSVKKYESKKTGMKFYSIDLPLPLIKLEICVQTKPYDDTGCAHTLEHLIFLGSRKYPQQGYLDYISAQHYSLGTNATTYRDMTTYELTSVNHQSLSTILPVYLDHVFHPLLTKDCYLTEVHHIAGDTGADAGVVYSEMQSSENQPDEILLFSILRDLWSDKSPYHYESGGRLESIRNELTLDKIKLFHQKFYKPSHVAIILSGDGIDVNQILTLLDQFEEEYFSSNGVLPKLSLPSSTEERQQQQQRKKTKFLTESSPFIQIKQASSDEDDHAIEIESKKPPRSSIDKTKLAVQLATTDGNESSFCDSEMMVSHEDLSVPSLPTSFLPAIEIDNSMFQRHMTEYKEICYPVEDNEDSLGQVAFGYRLESIYEMEIYTALDVLLTTLFDEDISIFYKEFIEIPNTFCSSIDHEWYNYPERVLTITFEGVEVDNLTIVADKYTSILYSLINSPIENEQFSTQLERNIKKQMELHFNELENDPYNYLTDLCCLDHISELSLEKNKTDQDHLHEFLQNQKYLESLSHRSLSYWYELIKKYLLEWDLSKRTVILLKPSNDLLIEQQEQEEQRMADRLQTLGSHDLKKLQIELDEARANNKQSSSQCANISTPSIPCPTQIHLPPIQYYSHDHYIDLFDCPTSHFNKYTLHIPIANLPSHLQIYLPLFSNLLFHTAIDYADIHLEKYPFCELFTRDILAYSVANGQTSASPVQSSFVHTHYMDTFIISLQSVCNEEIFRNTINYLRYVLFGMVVTDYKIIREECEKQLKNLIEILQDGQSVHQAYFNSLLHSNEKKNYYHQMNIFKQKKFFEKISRHPEKYEKEVVNKLQSIQRFLLHNLARMHLTICGNVELIKKHWLIIDQFLNEMKMKSQFTLDDQPIEEIEEKHVHSSTTIIGNLHEESGYVVRWTRVVISPKDFVPLLILSNYLDMENGPLWTACRTNGYSYGVAFDFDFETNLILLSINQCSQLTLAYSSALSTLKSLITHRTACDLPRLHAARNLTICMLTEHFASLGRAMGVCIRSYLNSYSLEKYQELIKEIHSFEFTEDIHEKMIEKYLVPLVNEDQASTLILVNSNKTKETQVFLQKEHAMANVIIIKDVVKHFSRSKEDK